MNRTWIIETEAEPNRGAFLTQSGNVFTSDSNLAQGRNYSEVCHVFAASLCLYLEVLYLEQKAHEAACG